ncbi:dihydropteroate synthase [Microvenator marinus]|jgi:dihydropteroate synthase|uniref:Dihydropteroate synthase n=1 Tax=Microvenator marinus TaxID=2600177 RepID=A0A5B8XLT1_9DELT|nr:dihydropteroate synthase [Microvenator marinus]QED26565.1 dihydropteroate synthase [Microvenator marinus]
MTLKVMGIVNVTPDSFSDGGKFLDVNAAISHGLQLLEDGADILDIGGESTRPGAQSVSESDELARVLPVIEGILKKRPDAIISIDTTKSEVAAQALELGASIVNDVSAGTFDPRIMEVSANHGAELVLMHMQGTPRTMQKSPSYEDVVEEVFGFLSARAQAAEDAGVRRENIILDPGIGFGKKLEHNLLLIKNLSRLSDRYQVLLGVSRKSFIGELTGQKVDKRLAGTLATLPFAVGSRVSIVRVHDVRETVDFLKVFEALS